MALRATPENFWSQIDQSGDCWHWTGVTNNQGYGQLTYHQKRWTAHRFSWVLAFGEIPEKLCVLHHCDVRSCVRPLHLFLGTYADNSHDAVAKGRASGGSSKGEINPAAKLNVQAVREIRRLRKAGWTQDRLATHFKISQSQISNIVCRRLWAHL